MGAMEGMEGMEDMPISYDARLVDGKAARALRNSCPGSLGLAESLV
jgi:hypothetical protein